MLPIHLYSRQSAGQDDVLPYQQQKYRTRNYQERRACIIAIKPRCAMCWIVVPTDTIRQAVSMLAAGSIVADAVALSLLNRQYSRF